MTDTTIEAAFKAEPCANCGSPLAADQRYCLNCGDRRAEARLDFIDILSEDASARVSGSAPVMAAAAPEPRPGAEGWLRSHAGLLALAGVIIGTLIAGVLIGTVVNGDDPSGSSKPQVIKVQGGGTATTADDSASSGDSSSSDDSPSADDSSSSAGSKNSSGGEKGGSGDTSGVQSADGKSKKDIEKATDSGEALSTGKGTSKTDDKAAGGGSDFETIQ